MLTMYETVDGRAKYYSFNKIPSVKGAKRR